MEDFTVGAWCSRSRKVASAMQSYMLAAVAGDAAAYGPVPQPAVAGCRAQACPVVPSAGDIAAIPFRLGVHNQLQPGACAVGALWHPANVFCSVRSIITRKSRGHGAEFPLLQVDIDAPDLEQFPQFADLKHWDCILEPGDMLFIPTEWWHYVKSLTVSFSVSFWWQ
jgi:Cupin-like domain